MTDSLLDKVTTNFPAYSRLQVRNFLLFTLCLLRKQTVCLNKMKGCAGGLLGKPTTTPEAHYKRLLRIFTTFAFTRLWLDLTGCAFQLLRLQTTDLILDGTSWKRGQKWRHFMTLGVIYQGVCIPFFWVNLAKEGISSTKERKKLFKRATRFFHLSGMRLLADREYIGKEWFNFLIDNNIDFIIRLRYTHYKQAIDRAPGRSYQGCIDKVLRSRIPHKTLSKAFWLEGVKLYFIVSKNPDPKGKEPYLLLITNQEIAAKKVVIAYGQRWKIEHCFKHLKSNGFDLEKMNLKGKARQDLLLAFVVFAYVLSIHEGLKNYKKVRQVVFRSGAVSRRKSVFRQGLDYLESLCHDLHAFCQYFIRQIEQSKKSYRSNKIKNVQ